jgi:hypothetical protein
MLMIRAMMTLLQPLVKAWTGAALLPVPLLLALDPSGNAEIACLYLGVASAWLATAIFRTGGLPNARAGWMTKTIALGVVLTINVALFILLGHSAGVQSNIPFPLTAVLSVIPAIGLVPWMTVRVRDPFIAMALSALIVVSAKLAGCVVARIVYGPNYLAQGYASDDWRTAKVMITVFWTLSTMVSLGLLVAGYRQHRPRRVDTAM